MSCPERRPPAPALTGWRWLCGPNVGAASEKSEIGDAMKPPTITPLEFEPADHDRAEKMAQALGYEQTAYTSTSALWGLFCLPENPATHPTMPHRRGCIIKTAELGLLFVQDDEDMGVEL